jgi:hypothetical protein
MPYASHAAHDDVAAAAAENNIPVWQCLGYLPSRLFMIFF